MPSLHSRERGLKSKAAYDHFNVTLVAPLAGAWIEIYIHPFSISRISVAPLAGAWIEISVTLNVMVGLLCRSPRGSVDLNTFKDTLHAILYVAPLAGAWIEILPVHTFHKQNIVAPLAGAWIEIYREPFIDPETDVAPLAGAWIEIGVAGAR